MNRKFAVLAAVVTLSIATAAIAAEEVILVAPAAPIQPAGGTVVSPTTTVVPPTSVHVTAQPVPTAMQPVPFQEAAPLFTNVKIRDPRRIACNSVPMVVTVKDPCACRDVCSCGPKCVNVLVCVPGCTECPPKVTCKKDGAYVKYNFGTYRVVVRSKKGFVEIDYDGPKSQSDGSDD